jgi:hypothetical protein
MLAQAMINSTKTKDNGVITLRGKTIWEYAKAKF